MIKRVIEPIVSVEVTSESGIMTDNLRRWIFSITDRATIIGTGSPESVVEAPQGCSYMDDAGTSGNIMYVKRDADVLGDTTKGWVLI